MYRSTFRLQIALDDNQRLADAAARLIGQIQEDIGPCDELPSAIGRIGNRTDAYQEGFNWILQKSLSEGAD